MSDRRLTPANGRVAAARLQGIVEAERFVDGEKRRVLPPLADLCRAPGGPRDRQVLMGEVLTMLEDLDGWSFVQTAKDGYVGYVQSALLGDGPKPTHWVAVPAGHIYSEPDMKSPELGELVFGDRVSCISHQPRFHETAEGGYIPKPHLWPIDKRFTDPVTVAQMHFGAPYLWGGNSVRGIDCSGLVQAAFVACGLNCPGDSDMQQEALGVAFGDNVALQRGDLLFWKGHVGMMVDGETLIHANAFHMAVAYEPVEKAIKRIEAQGDGPVISRKRV